MKVKTFGFELEIAEFDRPRLRGRLSASGLSFVGIHADSSVHVREDDRDWYGRKAGHELIFNKPATSVEQFIEWTDAIRDFVEKYDYKYTYSGGEGFRGDRKLIHSQNAPDAGSSCGLHIHYGVPSRAEFTLAKCLKIVHNTHAAEPRLLQLALRHNKNYAGGIESSGKITDERYILGTFYINSERYMGLNLNNLNPDYCRKRGLCTVEYRYAHAIAFLNRYNFLEYFFICQNLVEMSL